MPTNNTDIADFYRQISLLLKSGLPLPDSIYQLGSNFEKRDFREVLINISDETLKGATLATAMKKYPHYFTDFQIRMIEEGEKNGILPETLAEIARSAHLNLQLTSMVRELAVYPVFGIGLSFTVLFSLTTLIVPEFRSIFEEMLEGAPLPWLTDKVMDITGIFIDYWQSWVIFIFLYVLFFSWLFFGGGIAKKVFIYIISMIPGAGRIFYNLIMARICSMWSILIKQKINTPEILLIISGLIDSFKISSALKRISEKTKLGNSIVQSMKEEKAISGMIDLAIEHVPEKDLAQELENLSLIFRERASTATRKAGAIWGLVLIIILAITVGIIVLSLFLPLISIIKMLGGG